MSSPKQYHNTIQAEIVESRMMSLGDAARDLGVAYTTAWDLYKKGMFPVPVTRIGSRLRVVRAHVDQFIATGEPVRRGGQSDNVAP